MTAEELIALNEEISALARAGLPLDQGLAALAREMNRGRLRRVTAELADDLRQGRTLPEALSRQGERVPPFYAALVTAGIRTGRIGEVLATLTAHARSMANMKAIILEALFYPLVVLLLAVVLVGFLLVVVLPRFREIFAEFNMKLPFLTEAMFALGQRPGTLFFLPVGGLVVFFLATRSVLRSTPAGQRAWTRRCYTVPLVGTLMRSAQLAAFTDLLSILVHQEVPLTEAFHLAGEASSDPLLSQLAEQVRAALGQGHPLGEVLRGQGLVPEWVAWMAGLGEQRGQLGEALKQIAEMYRRQVEMRAGLLRSVLPPLLVIVTAGVFVGCFVFALMLPMIKLLEGLAN